MPRRHFLITAAAVVWSGGAAADVPVADLPRQGTEKSIADCMHKARVYKDQTLDPSKGVTKSVKTPGSASGTVPATGKADVTGTKADVSNGKISGMDFSNLQPAQTDDGKTVYTPASLKMSGSAQTVLSLSNVSTAVSGNAADQLLAALAMGAAPLSQGAWDQNSQARANIGAQWNQVLMASLLTAQLFNQRTIDATAGASATADMLTYDPTRATIVGPVGR